MRMWGIRAFDTSFATLYATYMTSPPLHPNQLHDQLRPAEEKTAGLGFRIFKSHKKILEEEYKGNISAVVRFLLCEFFKPNSQLRTEFDKKLKTLTHNVTP